jgi:hypothetical protein
LRHLPVCGHPTFQQVPTSPICAEDAIEIGWSLGCCVMSPAFLPTEIYRSHRPAHASPRRTDDVSARLRYSRTARYRMITLAANGNYPEKTTAAPFDSRRSTGVGNETDLRIVACR